MVKQQSAGDVVRKRITVKRLAEMGGVSYRTAHRWAAKGLVRPIRVGGDGRGRKILVLEEDAIEFLKSQEDQAAPDVGPLKFIRS